MRVLSLVVVVVSTFPARPPPQLRPIKLNTFLGKRPKVIADSSNTSNPNTFMPLDQLLTN